MSEDRKTIACRECYGTGRLYTPYKKPNDISFICPVCKGKKVVEPPKPEDAELPEHLRDPMAVLERGREVLKEWEGDK